MGRREEQYQNNLSQTQDNSLHRIFRIVSSPTDLFTDRRFCTQRLLHTDVFTHRRFYTQKLLHTEVFTHRRFYTQTLLHTEAFTHRQVTLVATEAGLVATEVWRDSTKSLPSASIPHHICWDLHKQTPGLASTEQQSSTTNGSIDA